jgi:hypothetical protein
MKKTKLPKGQHEEEVEYVKNLLHRGMGIVEIIELSSLSDEEVMEINNKVRDE